MVWRFRDEGDPYLILRQLGTFEMKLLLLLQAVGVQNPTRPFNHLCRWRILHFIKPLLRTHAFNLPLTKQRFSFGLYQVRRFQNWLIILYSNNRYFPFQIYLKFIYIIFFYLNLKNELFKLNDINFYFNGKKIYSELFFILKILYICIKKNKILGL